MLQQKAPKLRKLAAWLIRRCLLRGRIMYVHAGHAATIECVCELCVLFIYNSFIGCAICMQEGMCVPFIYNSSIRNLCTRDNAAGLRTRQVRALSEFAGPRESTGIGRGWCARWDVTRGDGVGWMRARGGSWAARGFAGAFVWAPVEGARYEIYVGWIYGNRADRIENARALGSGKKGREHPRL